MSDNPSFDDYYDFTPGSTQSVSGHFIEVPKNIATGLDSDGSELKAADVGFPLPPTNGSWQRDLRSTIALGIDGPQWVLEYWSDINNVFQFVRVEDIAYDKRKGMGNVVYVVDSGRGTAGDPQAGRSTNGRVWKMVLETRSTSRTTSSRPGPACWSQRIRDRASSSRPAPRIRTPRRLASGTCRSRARIVDASAAFGPVAFLVDVQSHTLWVEKADGEDNFPPAGPDFTYKREGGQLLLIKIKGI